MAKGKGQKLNFNLRPNTKICFLFIPAICNY